MRVCGGEDHSAGKAGGDQKGGSGEKRGIGGPHMPHTCSVTLRVRGCPALGGGSGDL